MTFPNIDLLVDQILIAREEDLKTIGFRDAEEFTVLEAIPAPIGGGFNLMSRDVVAQSMRKILVEQNSHEASCSR